MSSPADSLKGALYALVRGALARVDYFALYRAKVVRQSGRKLDVQPDDKRLPGMSEVPFKIGIPGVEVTFAPGAHVLVGWEGGDPGHPYCIGWEGGETVTALTIKAATAKIEATTVTVDALKTDLGGTCVPVVEGVLNGTVVDTITGLPHWMLGNSSTKVNAKK